MKNIKKYILFFIGIFILISGSIATPGYFSSTFSTDYLYSKIAKNESLVGNNVGSILDVSLNGDDFASAVNFSTYFSTELDYRDETNAFFALNKNYYDNSNNLFFANDVMESENASVLSLPSFASVLNKPTGLFQIYFTDIFTYFDRDFTLTTNSSFWCYITDKYADKMLLKYDLENYSDLLGKTIDINSSGKFSTSKQKWEIRNIVNTSIGDGINLANAYGDNFLLSFYLFSGLYRNAFSISVLLDKSDYINKEVLDKFLRAYKCTEFDYNFMSFNAKGDRRFFNSGEVAFIKSFEYPLWLSIIGIVLYLLGIFITLYSIFRLKDLEKFLISILLTLLGISTSFSTFYLIDFLLPNNIFILPANMFLFFITSIILLALIMYYFKRWKKYEQNIF